MKNKFSEAFMCALLNDTFPKETKDDKCPIKLKIVEYEEFKNNEKQLTKMLDDVFQKKELTEEDLELL